MKEVKQNLKASIIQALTEVVKDDLNKKVSNDIKKFAAKVAEQIIKDRKVATKKAEKAAKKVEKKQVKAEKETVKKVKKNAKAVTE